MRPDDPEVEKWLAEINEEIKKDLIPKMRGSAFVLGLVDENLDVYMLLQVGAALLLEKPLILIVLKGAWIPKKARELADAVVELDSMKDPDSQEKLRAAIGKVIAKTRGERKVQ